MKFTHRKRAYRARAFQLRDDNVENIALILKSHGVLPHIRHDGIMIRWEEAGQLKIDMVFPGHWVVIGENGKVKTYSNEQFNIKYEELK